MNEDHVITLGLALCHYAGNDLPSACAADMARRMISSPRRLLEALLATDSTGIWSELYEHGYEAGVAYANGRHTEEADDTHECVFVEEQEPSGRLILSPCIVCGLTAMDALEQLRGDA